MEAEGRERAACLLEGTEGRLQAWLGGGEAEFGAEAKGGGLVFVLHWAVAFPHSPLLQPQKIRKRIAWRLGAHKGRELLLSPVRIRVLAAD